jgi:hypothetical protein
LLRIKVHAARRSASAAPFFPRRTRLDFTLPPIFCQFGHNPSQQVKCLSVGHLLKSLPNALTSVKACMASIPSIAFRSTPVA